MTTQHLEDIMTTTLQAGHTTQIRIIKNKSKPPFYVARMEDSLAKPYGAFIGKTPLEAYSKLAAALEKN